VSSSEKYFEQVSSNFFILASEQRLKILLSLLEERSKSSILAKRLGTTPQEAHRNLEKMADAGLIKKRKRRILSCHDIWNVCIHPDSTDEVFLYI